MKCFKAYFKMFVCFSTFYVNLRLVLYFFLMYLCILSPFGIVVCQLTMHTDHLKQNVRPDDQLWIHEQL